MNKQVRKIYLADARQKIPDKTAMLTAATSSDRYRIGDTWHTVGMPAEWGYQPVDEVVHFGNHRTQPGDVLIVHDLDDSVIAHIQVDSITLTSLPALQLDHLQTLGFKSVDEVESIWGNILRGGIWYITFEHVTARAGETGTVQ